MDERVRFVARLLDDERTLPTPAPERRSNGNGGSRTRNLSLT
jgi:hypothetical protein